MKLEILISEGQLRGTGSETAACALWVSSEFDAPCKERKAIPRWALLLRALASRVQVQQDYITKLEQQRAETC